MIKDPYKFTPTELDIIKKNFKDHTDWGKACFSQLKKNLKEKLIIEQKYQCCYCKQKITNGFKTIDIEHILPKSKYSKFTFNSKNLALACPKCNTNKSNKDVVSDKIVRYPRNGKKIKIIHPHFDLYNDHIDIDNGLIYIPKSAKGCETIELCKLFQLRKVEENAKSIIIEQSEISSYIDSVIKDDQEQPTDIESFIDSLPREIQVIFCSNPYYLGVLF